MIIEIGTIVLGTVGIPVQDLILEIYLVRILGTEETEEKVYKKTCLDPETDQGRGIDIPEPLVLTTDIKIIEIELMINPAIARDEVPAKRP